MISRTSLLKSVVFVSLIALLAGTGACTFSRGPIQGFVTAPEAGPSDGADTIVGGSDNATTPTGSDETIAPTNTGNATPAQQEPANEDPTDGTPPLPTPPAGNDVCHRIAYASNADGKHDELFVANDCKGFEAIRIPLTSAPTTDHVFTVSDVSFSLDGNSLIASSTAWIAPKDDSLFGESSTWDLTGSTPTLQSSRSADRDRDGLADVLSFGAFSEPEEPLAHLVVASNAPVCGNSVVEGFEQCDNGGIPNANFCTADCRLILGIPEFDSPKFIKTLTLKKKLLVPSVPTPANPSVHTDPFLINEDGTLEIGRVAISREHSVVFAARFFGEKNFRIFARDMEDPESSVVTVIGLNQPNSDTHDPSFSPDGSRMVLVKNDEIWTVPFTVVTGPNNGKQYQTTGHSSTNLSVGLFAGAHNSSPCFSHDGRYVFFLSDASDGGLSHQEHDREVWRVELDGSNPVNVSNDAVDQTNLSCSPAAGPTGILK